MNICQYHPPATMAIVAGVCEQCGHAIVCHVGVTQCTICYQLALSSAMRQAAMELAATMRRAGDAIQQQPWPST
jgi:hypothetical protein